MGEYAIFVWPCYAATIVFLTVLCFSSWQEKRKNEKRLAELQDRLNKLNEQE